MADFQRRHYEAVALIMQDAHRQAEAEQGNLAAVDLVFHVQEDFAALFMRDNPQFKRGRFLIACTPGKNVRERT